MSQVFANIPSTTSPYDGVLRVTLAADIVKLYRQLKLAPADSDDFELLCAEFNRVCDAAPESVLRALAQEELTA